VAQTQEIDRDTLRSLAELHPHGARVLSLYLNLDPREFAAPAARATAVRSLLDDADRTIRADETLSHEERGALKQDLKRARDFLARLSGDGAHGLALFVCGPADLFEEVRLPRAVEHVVRIDRRPYVEPLVQASVSGEWCVLLANRRTSRLMRGTPERLEEVETLSDDVHGQHDQGGWSQARYQRGIDKEVTDHLKATAELVHRHFRRSPFDRLLVGMVAELYPELERALQGDLRQRLTGRFDVDVENTSVDEVLKATVPHMRTDVRAREDEAIERLRAGVASNGHGVGGLADVLRALNERRVEILLLDEDFSADGTICPRCGWMGATEVTSCPADGEPVDAREDLLEDMVERALEQSAEVLRLHERPDLGPFGGVGAVLRF
jgi:peptide chain release factor subunit 1